MTLRHALGEQKPFDRLFNIGPIRWSGDFSTVSQSGAPPLNPLGNPSAIASLRMVVEVGNWDASRFSLPGGQSGNPLSPHYADQVEPWRTGAGIPMPYSAEAVTNATTETLHLVPKSLATVERWRFSVSAVAPPRQFVARATPHAICSALSKAPAGRRRFGLAADRLPGDA